MAHVLQRFLTAGDRGLFSGLGVLVDAFFGLRVTDYGAGDYFWDGQQIVMSWLGSEYGFGSSDWHHTQGKIDRISNWFSIPPRVEASQCLIPRHF